MQLKEMVFAVALAISTGVSGWMWNLYSDLNTIANKQDTAIAVLDAGKADKTELHAVQQQMGKLIAIQESQKVLMEQQFRMLEYMIKNGKT